MKEMRRLWLGLVILLCTSPAMATEFELNETTGLANTSDLTRPQYQECIPVEGTSVLVLEQIAALGVPNKLSKIRILEGDCQDAVGWIYTHKLREATNTAQ